MGIHLKMKLLILLQNGHRNYNMNKKEIQALFDELVKRNGGKEPSMEELNKQFDEFVKLHLQKET